MTPLSHIEQQQFEEIEAYLLERLSPREKEIFEAALENEPELQKELEVQRTLMQAVQIAALREQLDSIAKDRELKADLSGELRSKRYWYAIAASVIALVGVGIWILLQPPANERIFAEYASADPGLPVPMSATDNYNFYDAMVDYKNEQYDKALAKWRTLLENHPDSDTLHYYIGAAEFNRGNYATAAVRYEHVLAMGRPSFRAKSQWYLVLCWLQTGEYGRIAQMAEKADPAIREDIRALQEALTDLE